MLDALKSFASSDIREKDTYVKALGEATEFLSKTSGLVDLEFKPTFVIADLHGRYDYLLQALQFKIGNGKGKKSTVLELLQAGKINFVCLGDGMHSEARGKLRWQIAQRELFRGHSPAMDEEMGESLNTMLMVMMLITEFPNNFFFLRGNHDDIKGQFRKYARESDMVQLWCERRFGKDFIDSFAEFENALPLMVRGNNFIASHSATLEPLNRGRLSVKDYRTYYNLAWSDNRYLSDNNYNNEAFNEQMLHLEAKDCVWVIGHRPTENELFRSQFGNRLIQLNRPDKFVAAYIKPNQFDVNKQIFFLKEK